MASLLILPTPGVQVTEDQSTFFVAAQPVRDATGKLHYEISNHLWGANNANSIGSLMDPDPSIVSAVSVIDGGAPSSYLFTFGLPIVPTTGPVSLRLTVAGSCTEILSTGGCSATPTLPSGLFAQGLLDGVPLVFGGSVFSGPPGGSGAFASTVFTVSLPAATTYTALGLELGFMGSGGGDAISFTLGVEVLPTTTVSAPATAGLTLLALGLMGALARRRPGA